MGCKPIPRTKVVICAPIGPNPAPLSELIWALVWQKNWWTHAIRVVADAAGQHYLEREFLAKNAALDQLRATLGDDIGDRKTVHIQPLVLPDGADFETDDNPEHAAIYNAAVWQAAKAAIAESPHGRVVFGLIAGRRRTMTAVQTMVFQLLARPQDVCIDVRVSDRRVEGGTGFFFPDQAYQIIQTQDGPVAAADVKIHLVEVELPRLSGLLGGQQFDTYEEALAASQTAIKEASPPSLLVDQ